MRLLAKLLVALAVLTSAFPAEAGLRHRVYVPPPTNCTGAPAGVVSLNLCDVYVLKSTNGPRIGLTNVSAYSFPTGGAYNAGSQNTDISGSGTAILGITNAGHGGIYYAGNGTHTLTDFAITSNAGVSGAGFPFVTGQTSGGAITGTTNVDAEHGSIDGSGGLNSSTHLVLPHGQGAFTLGYTNLLHPARDHFVTDGSPNAVYTLHHLYFDAYAQNTGVGDHNEWGHFLSCGAGSTVTYSYGNMADGTPGGANSGGWQIQTGIGLDPTTYSGGPCSITFSGNVFNYGAVINQSTWSGKAVFDDVDIYIGAAAGIPGNIWSVAATAPTASCLAQADIKVGSVTGTWASLENFTATGGKAGTEQGALTSGNNLHLITPGTGGALVVGNMMTGSTSGATATVTSVGYHHCIIHNLGGNVDFSGNSVSP